MTNFILTFIILLILYTPAYFGTTYLLIRLGYLPKYLAPYLPLYPFIKKRNLKKFTSGEKYEWDDKKEQVLEFISEHPRCIALLNKLPELIPNAKIKALLRKKAKTIKAGAIFIQLANEIKPATSQFLSMKIKHRVKSNKRKASICPSLIPE